MNNLARSSGRQSSEGLNKGRHHHILPILPYREESQQIMNVLSSHTLRKVIVADVKGNQTASKSNPGDSREAHTRNGQFTHTCIKCVSGVYPPLNKGKKEIMVRSTSLGGKSSNEMANIESPDELDYVTKQIVK